MSSFLGRQTKEIMLMIFTRPYSFWKGLSAEILPYPRDGMRNKKRVIY